ncbi:MAG TPA: methyltransferase domain-containing protein [Planctomycetes bacterium]|nr:methyltransferase domain-containing protein [Planctomycetota bacterium]HIK59497.1 methyltransferase domain-containing protein [Planctomycetota bacterium]
MNADLLELPFDQYQRYRLVADILKEVRPKGRKLSILDVGGRTALLRQFLPQDDVTAVDLEMSDEPGLVLGDGSRLPFQDGSFDVVAGFDTLEHVPPARRTAFVDECARVASRWVVLIGPYAAKRVNEAEERLVDFLREKLKTEHRYLNEHRSHGLPSLGEVERTLHKHGLRTACVGQGSLDRWLGLMCLELYLDADPCLRPVAKRFFRFYNETLYSSDHGGDMYRHALVGAKGEAPLPKQVALDRDPVANPAATRSVLALARELLALDSERDVWAPEFERLRGVIGDLEEDLAGHKSRLVDLNADLDGHRTSLKELENDRNRQEEAQAVLCADLDGQRNALAQREEDLVASNQLLAGQRMAAEAMEKELREQLEAHVACRQELMEEQAALQSHQVELQGALEARVADAAVLNADLDFLRGSLRNRADNLRRVLRGRQGKPYLPPRGGESGGSEEAR